jgi:uncharacterized membrane protein YccC
MEIFGNFLIGIAVGLSVAFIAVALKARSQRWQLKQLVDHNPGAQANKANDA